MVNQKRYGKWFVYLFVVMTFCFLFAACSGEKVASDIMDVRRYEEEEGQAPLVYKNENLEMQFNKDTTQFSIKNLKTGMVWDSNPTDWESDQIASGDAASAIRSTLTLTYTTVNDVSTTIDNYKYSVLGKLYSVTPCEDKNGVEVKYTIGNVEKTYLIPLAVPASRMNELTEGKVSDSELKEIKNYYQILNFEKVKKKQDSAAILSQYPDLEKEDIYVIRDNLKEHLREELQTIFGNAGYTKEDYQADLERYDVSTATDKPAFNITVRYYLDDEDLVVEIPMEQIEYNPKYPIVQLTVLPYFGAGGLQDAGFVFVPDGNGGLINFNNGKKNQAAFNNNVYGWDYGVSRDAIVEETSSSHPLFGISKNDQSFLCISEKGSAYSFIEADISGKLTSYNFGRFSYYMLHREKLDITAKSDTTVQLFEKSIPKENIIQRYRFLDQGGYVDMAASYREYLMNRYPALVKDDKAEVPTMLEYIGAVDNVENMMGFPVTRPQALTKYKDAKAITEKMVADGIGNLSVKYTGWANKGINSSNMNKVKTISRLGSKKDMKDFANYAKSNGIDLYLDANFSFVYKDGWFDGFQPNRDVSKFVSRKLARWYPFSFIGYEPMLWYKDEMHYFVRPSYTVKSIDNYAKQIANLGVDNISFADVGYILGADYNPKKSVSRETAMDMQQGKLEELKGQNKKVLINSDNAYAMPYADYALGMTLNYSNKNIVDEKVPFFSIVFHGLLPYAGTPLNVSQDYEVEVLKAIENGAGMYYMLMNEPSLELQEGRFTKYYASDFSLWEQSILDAHGKFKEALDGTYNLFITDHKKLADNVYLTQYEDGRKVIVNYNEYDYMYNGKKVEAMGFVAEGGGNG